MPSPVRGAGRHEVSLQHQPGGAVSPRSATTPRDDDRRMELLAPGQQRLQQRDADRTTEVAHHVEQGGGGAWPARARSRRWPARTVASAPAPGRMARTRFGTSNWSPAVILVDVDVEEAARREQAKPDCNQQAASNRRISSGHERDQHELRQAGPGEHLADLLRIVALHLRQIARAADTPSRTAPYRG